MDSVRQEHSPDETHKFGSDEFRVRQERKENKITIVLCAGDFANNHFKVDEVPERVEIYFKLNIAVVYEPSRRNQGLSDQVVFDQKHRKAVDDDWFEDDRLEPGKIKFIGTM